VSITKVWAESLSLSLSPSLSPSTSNNNNNGPVRWNWEKHNEVESCYSCLLPFVAENGSLLPFSLGTSSTYFLEETSEDHFLQTKHKDIIIIVNTTTTASSL
jgi:hypothetical protein